MIKSILGALIGVQSEKQRHEDFTTGKLWQFIVAGIVAIGLFVAILIGIVALILA